MLKEPRSAAEQLAMVRSAPASSTSPSCPPFSANRLCHTPASCFTAYQLESPNLARFERCLDAQTCPGWLHLCALEPVDGKKMSAVGVGRRGATDFLTGIQ